MPTNNEDLDRIYKEWHEAFTTGDLERLRALYAADAVLESPSVLARTPDSGIVRGRDAIIDFFSWNLSARKAVFGQWYRSNERLAHDGLLMWEYPRDAPGGDQADLIESMDIVDGLIQEHRVYWGWRSGKALIDEARGRRPEPVSFTPPLAHRLRGRWSRHTPVGQQLD